MVSVLANSLVSNSGPRPGGVESKAERKGEPARNNGPRPQGPPPVSDPVEFSRGALEQLQSLSLFSFRESFAQLTQVQTGGGNGRNFNSILESLDQQLNDIASMDARVGQELSILASVLKALNPDAADRMLETIEETFGRVQQMMGGSPQSAPTPDSPPPPDAPQSNAQGSGVAFSLDITIETSVSVSAAIAELRDNGFTVETVEMEATQRIQIHIEFGAQNQKKSDPIVLDLAGDGVNLTGVEDGKAFDIDADGKVDQTGFVQGDDAFLALDRNGNGTIDNGSELFGDQNGAENGWAELTKYDLNGDQRIDASDSIYQNLRLLVDADGDGNVRNDELRTLAEEGIASIDLNYDADWSRDDANGNTLAQRSSYTRTDGSSAQALDAWIAYRSA